jgi:hypothetical protein
MEQFEVGDRVRLKSIAALTALPTYEGHNMNMSFLPERLILACRHFGDLLTVAAVASHKDLLYFSDKEMGYSWNTEWFELVASAKLNGILRAEEEIVEQIWGNLR